MENAEPDSVGADHRPLLLQSYAARLPETSPATLINPIADLGVPLQTADQIWALTMEPGENARVVYGGTSKGYYGSEGKLFKYNPNSPGYKFTVIGDVSHEFAIHSLVTLDDSIYGGTSKKGHFFSYAPGGSINDFGAVYETDSMVSALVFGCALGDSRSVYGATSQVNFKRVDPDDPDLADGGHLFIYDVDSSRIRNLGRPVGSQRNIQCLTNFTPDTLGWVAGGTGPDSAYIFVRR
jgi:hypothetical protein